MNSFGTCYYCIPFIIMKWPCVVYFKRISIFFSPSFNQFIGSYLFFSALSSLFITDPLNRGYSIAPMNLGGDSTLLLISIFIMSHCNALWVRATQEEFIAAAQQQHQRASHPASVSSVTHPQQYGSIAPVANTPSSSHQSRQPPSSLPKVTNKSPEKKIFTLSDV